MLWFMDDVADTVGFVGFISIFISAFYLLYIDKNVLKTNWNFMHYIWFDRKRVPKRYVVRILLATWTPFLILLVSAILRIAA